MSGQSTRAVPGLVALWLLLTLSACGEQSTERPTATPQVEPVPQAEPGGRSEPPVALGESQPLQWRLREGSYTAEARNRVAELESSDGRIAAEAQRALTRLGRDAVPALVEALDGERHSWRTKQLRPT